MVLSSLGTLTEEDILSSREYREGYEVYEHYKTTGKFLGGGGKNPYGQGTSDLNPTCSADLWIAGAHSAYGNDRGHRKAGTKPIDPVWARQVQLSLFD